MRKKGTYKTVLCITFAVVFVVHVHVNYSTMYADSYSYSTQSIKGSLAPVSVPVVLAASKGVIMARNWSLLSKYGGHLELNHLWAVSILRRMDFLQKRGSTPMKGGILDQEILHLKFPYLSQISEMAKANKFLPELIVNWDHAGINSVPSHNWTMEQQG